MSRGKVLKDEDAEITRTIKATIDGLRTKGLMMELNAAAAKTVRDRGLWDDAVLVELSDDRPDAELRGVVRAQS